MSPGSPDGTPGGYDDPTAVQGRSASGRPKGRGVSGRPRVAREDRYAQPRIHERDLGRRGPITPFSRLARTHLLSVAGDALFTIGLATTVFFNTDPNAPRGQVALYLMLTLAPFAIASPFIGPLVDRAAGGRRWMLFGAALARALVAFLLMRDLHSFAFYIEAFLMLVLSKVHLISKSALLPTTVRTDDELVEANSKLSLLGALAAVVVGGPGLAVSKLFGDAGPSLVLGLAMVAFLATAFQAFALPDVKVSPEPEGVAEREELRGAGILHALSAMTMVRLAVGFLTFLIAFDFRSAGQPTWWYLVVAMTAQAGFLVGSGIAPVLRRRLVEEKMLMLAVAATLLSSAAGVFLDDLGAAALISFGIGMTSSVAKQGFDALVQRDAPDANRGRSFARFEARFQLVWVIGAFIPVVLSIPLEVGFLFIALVSAYALASYLVAFRRVQDVIAGRRAELPPRPEHWRKLLDVLRERRRPGEDSTDGDPSPAGVGIGSHDPTLTGAVAAAGQADAGVDPTVALDAASLQGPGLFGVPDVGVPDELVAAPTVGLFAPEGLGPAPAPESAASPTASEVGAWPTVLPAAPPGAGDDLTSLESTVVEPVTEDWHAAEPRWAVAGQPRLPGFDDTGGDAVPSPDGGTLGTQPPDDRPDDQPDDRPDDRPAAGPA